MSRPPTCAGLRGGTSTRATLDAEGADELVRWPEPTVPSRFGGGHENDDDDDADAGDGGDQDRDDEDDGHSGRQSPPSQTMALAGTGATATAAVLSTVASGAAAELHTAAALGPSGPGPEQRPVSDAAGAASAFNVISSTASTAAVAGEQHLAASLRWSDALARSYGLQSSDDGHSGTGDSGTAGDDDDGGTAIGSYVALYAGHPGTAAPTITSTPPPTGTSGYVALADDAGGGQTSRLDTDALTISSQRPAGGPSPRATSEGSTISGDARSRLSRPVPSVAAVAPQAGTTKAQTPPRASAATSATSPVAAAIAGAGSSSSRHSPSPRSLSTSNSALLAMQHIQGSGSHSGSHRSRDRGIASIAADLGAPTSSSDPAELQRLAAAASTQATAETMAARGGVHADIDLISRRSSRGGDEDEDEEGYDDALFGSMEAAEPGAASIMSGSVVEYAVASAATAAGVPTGTSREEVPVDLPGPARRRHFARGDSTAALPPGSFDDSDEGFRLRSYRPRREYHSAASSAAGVPAASTSRQQLDPLDETDVDRESNLTPGTAAGEGGGDGCSVAEAAAQDLARDTDHGDADSVHAAAASPLLMPTSEGIVARDAGRRPPSVPGGHWGRRVAGAEPSASHRWLPPRAASRGNRASAASGDRVPISARPSMVAARPDLGGGSMSIVADDGRSLASGCSEGIASSHKGPHRTSNASQAADAASAVLTTGAASVSVVHGSLRDYASNSLRAAPVRQEGSRGASRLSLSSRGSSASSFRASVDVMGAARMAVFPAGASVGASVMGGTSAVSESGTSVRGVSRRRTARHRHHRGSTTGTAAAMENNGAVTEEDEANGGSSEHESQVVTAHGQDVAYAVRNRYGVDGAAGYDDEDEEGDMLDDDEAAFYAGADGEDAGQRFEFRDRDDEEEDGDDEHGDDEEEDNGIGGSADGGSAEGGLLVSRSRAGIGAGVVPAPTAPSAPLPWQSIIEAASRGEFPDVPSLLAALLRSTSDSAAEPPARAGATGVHSAADDGGLAQPRSTQQERRQQTSQVESLLSPPASIEGRLRLQQPPHQEEPAERDAERVSASDAVNLWSLPAAEFVRMSALTVACADVDDDWWNPPPSASTSAGPSVGRFNSAAPLAGPTSASGSASASFASPAPAAGHSPASGSSSFGTSPPLTTGTPETLASGDSPLFAPPTSAEAAGGSLRRRTIERPGSAVPRRRERLLRLHQERRHGGVSGSEAAEAPPPPGASLPRGAKHPSHSLSLPPSSLLWTSPSPSSPLALPRSPIARLGTRQWLELLEADYPPLGDGDDAEGARGPAAEALGAYRGGGSARVQNPARLAARSAFASSGGGMGSGNPRAGFRRLWSASSAVLHRHRPFGAAVASAWPAAAEGSSGAGTSAGSHHRSAEAAAADAAKDALAAGEVADALLLDYASALGDGVGGGATLTGRRPRTADARPAAVAASGLQNRRPLASSRLQRAKHGAGHD